MTDQTGKAEGSSDLEGGELFRLMVESATDFAILTIDPNGRVTSWNPGAERLLGYTGEEILGQSADVIFTPEDQAEAIPDLERQQASSHGKALDERWTMRKDGSRFWASGLLMPLVDSRRGYVKIFRDLTMRHRAEEMLREREERFRLLASNIPQLVFRSKPDGMRTWHSPQWIDFTGVGHDESLGHGWLDAIHPDDREATVAAWDHARGDGRYEIEHRILRAADGEYRWRQTRAHPIERGPGQNLDWIGASTDVHDLRVLMERQQALVAELQHRTHNQLALVQAIANQTLRKSESLEAFRAEFNDRLRALSRTQEIIARANHRDIDLHTLVATELSAHGHASEQGVKFTIQGPPVRLTSASAQALALAIHELAANAWKYGALAQPSGQLSVAWRFEATEPERRIVLEWRESDVRMPAPGAIKREGFGAELIRRALPYQLHAETTLKFGPDGVRCTISAPASKWEEGRG